MHNTGIELPDGMKTEIDNRRHSTVSRGQWLRDAARVRIALEDADEWPPDDVVLEEDEGQSTV